VLAGCNTRGALYHPTLSPSWDAAKGKKLIEYYGCGACHVIGGVPNANGHVGPPLTHFTRRYHQIAGVLPNTPQNVVRWIRDPKKFVPKVDMPVLGVAKQGAEDITAYLYGQ
jgi:cytochrome c2